MYLISLSVYELMAMIAAFVLAVLFLVIAYEKKLKKEKARAKFVAEESVIKQVTEALQDTDYKLFSDAWFYIIRIKAEEDFEKEATRRAKESNIQYQKWDMEEPRSKAVDLERDMRSAVENATTRAAQLSIVGQYVPKIISSLVRERLFIHYYDQNEQALFRELQKRYNMR